VQVDPNKYDIDNREPYEKEDKMVVLLKNGNSWLRRVYQVQAKPVALPPPILMVQEEGDIVTQPPVRGTRWDQVEKQNSFQYKYKARKAAAAE
jgi:hypothetical protein